MYVIYDDFYLKHYSGPSHPENENRLIAIRDALNRWELNNEIVIRKPVYATDSRIGMVHDKQYIEQVMNLSQKGSISYLDADTAVTEHTYRCALLAAGGCFKGLELIFESKNRFDRFFAAVRPPGHHAFRGMGSGFCIFNNIALSARYAQEKWGIKRIAIIDFDAHHGNGTQEVFYDDPSVFYISFHQYPHYPGTGYYTETGSGRGKGCNMNLPFRPQTDETDYLTAIVDIITPVMEEFDPGLFLVSAGYDSHLLDPLSSLNLVEESYFKIMSFISYLSRKHCKGKVGIVLEGGYEYNATARSVLETIKGCLGKKDSLETGDLKNQEVKNKDVLRSVKEIFKV